MQDLTWLITQRNRLVHFKSKTVELSKIGDELNLYTEKEAKSNRYS